MKGWRKKAPLRSDAERNNLVENNYGLVGRQVRKLAWLHRGHFEDAFQAGCLGLIRAAELYDERHGTAFSTYATLHIFQAIQRWAQANKIIRTPHGRGSVYVGRLPESRDDYFGAEGQQRDVLLTDKLHEALRSLPPRSRHVLHARLNGETIRSIGQRLGVSNNRVLQIYDAAIARLQKRLARLR